MHSPQQGVPDDATKEKPELDPELSSSEPSSSYHTFTHTYPHLGSNDTHTQCPLSSASSGKHSRRGIVTGDRVCRCARQNDPSATLVLPPLADHTRPPPPLVHLLAWPLPARVQGHVRLRPELPTRVYSARAGVPGVQRLVVPGTLGRGLLRRVGREPGGGGRGVEAGLPDFVSAKFALGRALGTLLAPGDHSDARSLRSLTPGRGSTTPTERPAPKRSSSTSGRLTRCSLTR